MNVTVERHLSLHSRFVQCANLTCNNNSTRDEFAIVTIGDYRALRLTLCVDCADALAAEAGR
jgi:hypothetical protein